MRTFIRGTCFVFLIGGSILSFATMLNAKVITVFGKTFVAMAEADAYFVTGALGAMILASILLLLVKPHRDQEPDRSTWTSPLERAYPEQSGASYYRYPWEAAQGAIESRRDMGPLVPQPGQPGSAYPAPPVDPR